MAPTTRNQKASTVPDIVTLKQEAAPTIVRSRIRRFVDEGDEGDGKPWKNHRGIPDAENAGDKGVNEYGENDTVPARAQQSIEPRRPIPAGRMVEEALNVHLTPPPFKKVSSIPTKKIFPGALRKRAARDLERVMQSRSATTPQTPIEQKLSVEVFAMQVTWEVNAAMREASAGLY